MLKVMYLHQCSNSTLIFHVCNSVIKACFKCSSAIMVLGFLVIWNLRSHLFYSLFKASISVFLIFSETLRAHVLHCLSFPSGLCILWTFQIH